MALVTPFSFFEESKAPLLRTGITKPIPKARQAISSRSPVNEIVFPMVAKKHKIVEAIKLKLIPAKMLFRRGILSVNRARTCAPRI